MIPVRVLFVARCKNGHYAPFIAEQVAALERAGAECRFFPVLGKGVGGYLGQFPEYKKVIREYAPDIIHAHYGLCGLFANLQRHVPVVVTYHGSDINDRRIRSLSRLSMSLSRFNIFVSQKNVEDAHPKRNYALIPCGVDMDDYPLIEKEEARKIMGLKEDGRYCRFAGAFGNPVKNAPLAQAAVSPIEGLQLLELKGYSRQQVATLMQAVDVLLMTSISEGSPQVIKEAMACGCPIVSVDVGDVKEQISGLDGCYVSERNVESLSQCLSQALSFHGRTQGRRFIEERQLTNDRIAEQIIDVYHRVTK